MKYLIFGVQGMAGHMIAQYLLEQGHSVIGFARTESKICPTICADAKKEAMVDQALLSNDFDYVINAIGVLNQAVDRDLASGIYLNSVFPHLLAQKLENTKTKLIHISTDCVFEGKKGAYTENDIPDAKSYYGRSKALGEVIDERNLTIRTSIVGPELKKDGIGLFHWFMSQKQPIYGYTHVIWSGVTTLQLAKTIEQDSQTPHVGLRHLVNNQTICKYELLRLFQQYCTKQHISIQANDLPISDKSLVQTKTDNMFIVPTYEQMIQEMAEWIQHHPNLYQQYLK